MFLSGVCPTDPVVLIAYQLDKVSCQGAGAAGLKSRQRPITFITMIRATCLRGFCFPRESCRNGWRQLARKKERVMQPSMPSPHHVLTRGARMIRPSSRFTLMFCPVPILSEYWALNHQEYNVASAN
jgi:hypothetical protein